ncbi:MAG: TIGR02757 family protein [Muribaculaceae bacterium]|nr:TIGR02757 family protein [Muribaculaceae bacterium]
MTKDIEELLRTEAARLNSPAFVADDPVQFPRRFSEQRDVEAASLLCATIAWGNRTMICRNCERMMGLLEWQPYAYIMDEGYETLPDGNVHRTFFNSNLKHYLRGLRRVFARYGSVEGLVRAKGVADEAAPAWALARELNRELCEANDGRTDSRCLPQNLDSTALKRLNMALRWLVRRDGIVDMGIWTALDPSQLYIPLDVHVGNTARDLGLLARRSNDRRAVEMLTAELRALEPSDPTLFDYALFGIGVTARHTK